MLRSQRGKIPTGLAYLSRAGAAGLPADDTAATLKLTHQRSPSPGTRGFPVSGRAAVRSELPGNSATSVGHPPGHQLLAQIGHPAAELEQIGIQRRGPGDGALRSAGSGVGGDQAQPLGLEADEQRHVLNQLLGAAKPMGAIEPHRLMVNVVGNCAAKSVNLARSRWALTSTPARNSRLNSSTRSWVKGGESPRW